MYKSHSPVLQLDRQKLVDKSKEELLDELQKAYDALNKANEEIDRLDNELRKHKNPNTPPSAHPHLKPDVKLKTSHARGAPDGHVGNTRPKQEADEKRHITQTECPNGHTNVTVVGIVHQQIEELPPDIKPTVVDVERDKLKCNDCGTEFVARDGSTPMQGRFGLNVIMLTILLKFVVRGVLRKTAGFLANGFAFHITPATVNAVIQRAAQAAEGEYRSLQENIRNARIVYCDETSFSVLGMKYWVWVFRTDVDVLLVIRHSRGNDVPKDVLGEGFSGILVCDGWRAYDALKNASIQRCWAHLLRKSADLNESASGRYTHHKLELLFARIQRFNAKSRSLQQRERKYEQLTGELKQLAAQYLKHPQTEGVAKYISFRVGEWFTCVRFEAVEPTNNFAEQALRETVVVRKIIGAFRSEHGTKVYESLASLLATWTLQKRDVSVELRRVLAAGLC